MFAFCESSRGSEGPLYEIYGSQTISKDGGCFQGRAPLQEMEEGSVDCSQLSSHDCSGLPLAARVDEESSTRKRYVEGGAKEIASVLVFLACTVSVIGCLRGPAQVFSRREGLCQESSVTRGRDRVRRGTGGASE